MADLSPNWIRWWFRGAALYGTLALLLLLVHRPPAGDVLFFYGFIGTALAFQLVFWIIGGDPVRYRKLMPACVVEKLGFVLPATALVAKGWAGGSTIVAGGIDLIIGIGMIVAWRATPRA